MVGKMEEGDEVWMATTEELLEEDEIWINTKTSNSIEFHLLHDVKKGRLFTDGTNTRGVPRIHQSV